MFFDKEDNVKHEICSQLLPVVSFIFHFNTTTLIYFAKVKIKTYLDTGF